MDRRRLALVVAVTLVFGSVARADDGPPPEARRAFSDGKAAFQRGEYEAALQAFQRAALIAPAPSLYYNIGMTYERLGRFEDSAIAFDRYIATSDPPQTAEDKKALDDLRARAAANHARALRSTPAPLVDAPYAPPPPQRGGYYAMPPVAYVPQLSHRERLDAARRHRNNAIALVTVGSIFIGLGVAVITVGSIDHFGGTQNDDGSYSCGAVSCTQVGVLFGGISAVIIGAPFFGKGLSAFVEWDRKVKEIGKEPDDNAAARRAMIDLDTPMVRTGNQAFVLSTPTFRF